MGIGIYFAGAVALTVWAIHSLYRQKPRRFTLDNLYLGEKH